MYNFFIMVKNKNIKTLNMRRCSMQILKKVALVLIIIGALNWGLIGIFDFNLVGFIFDNISEVISRIIYSLVGVAGIVSLVFLFLPDEE